LRLVGSVFPREARDLSGFSESEANGTSGGTTYGAISSTSSTESAAHAHAFTTDNGTGGGTSHPIMPNIRLEPQQRSDVIAFILSLKAD